MRHSGHKVGDMVICDYPTDEGQAMSRNDTGLVVGIRGSADSGICGNIELEIQWTAGDRFWFRSPGNLKVISEGKQ